MEAHLYLEPFSVIEAEKATDRLFVRLMWGHFGVSLLLAFWFHTFLPALLIGLPTAALFAWLARNQPCGQTTRCVGGVCLMVFSALFIQQTHGLTEMHFHIFCALAFLLAYRDWRVIVCAASVIAVHHLAFTILQLIHLPLFIYTSNMVNPWLLTLIHALFVVFESSILVILAIGMRAEWVRSEAAALYHDRMALAATVIASGDLTQMVQPVSDKDVLGKAFVQMITNLSEIAGKVQIAAHSIASTSAEVAAGNEDLSQRTEEQAASLEETAASMEEMAATVKHNADNSRQANQLAAQARTVAEKGGAVVSQAVTSMAEINVVSKRIADIITVIDEIAFQTNLLALNAAVEAARVGEQGKGFAVVAAEVRNLAGRSATAAKEIKALVLDSVSKVQEGNLHVNQSGQQLEEIVNAVKKVADVIAEISAAGQEQAEGIEQVNKAVIQMDQITQQNAALVEEATAASLSMSQQAGVMLETVGQFKLDARYQQAKPSATQMPVERKATGTHGRAANTRGSGRPSRLSSAPKLTLSPDHAPSKAMAADASGFEEF